MLGASPLSPPCMGTLYSPNRTLLAGSRPQRQGWPGGGESLGRPLTGIDRHHMRRWALPSGHGQVVQLVCAALERREAVVETTSSSEHWTRFGSLLLARTVTLHVCTTLACLRACNGSPCRSSSLHCHVAALALAPSLSLFGASRSDMCLSCLIVDMSIKQPRQCEWNRHTGARQSRRCRSRTVAVALAVVAVPPARSIASTCCVRAVRTKSQPDPTERGWMHCHQATQPSSVHPTVPTLMQLCLSCSLSSMQASDRGK